MDEPEGQVTPVSVPVRSKVRAALLVICTAGIDVGVIAGHSWRTPSGKFTFNDWLVAGASIVLTVLVTIFLIWVWRANAAIDTEAEARQRVRQAEDDLADSLRGGSETRITVIGDATIYRDAIAPEGYEQFPGNDEIPLERRDDGLTLAALWNLTHGRLDYYHQIVTGQARRSFVAAQAAMAIGFVLLVVFAILAAEARTTAAAVSAGGLGAVGAALSGYIAKTLIRSQETAAGQLRAYFDQPLELSRYLAAERLLADAKDLAPEKRAEILNSLVQAIATAGHRHDETKSRGRKASK